MKLENTIMFCCYRTLPNITP